MRWVCKPTVSSFRGTMTDEQRWHLVDYVRSFAKKP